MTRAIQPSLDAPCLSSLTPLHPASRHIPPPPTAPRLVKYYSAVLDACRKIQAPWFTAAHVPSHRLPPLLPSRRQRLQSVAEASRHRAGGAFAVSPLPRGKPLATLPRAHRVDPRDHPERQALADH